MKSAGIARTPETPVRVLCRQSGDDRRTVDAKRRKCLEIGLNAGAARRVGTGDGQRDGWRFGLPYNVSGDCLG